MPSCLCLFRPQTKHATEHRSPQFIFSLSSALTRAVVRGKVELGMGNNAFPNTQKFGIGKRNFENKACSELIQ